MKILSIPKCYWQAYLVDVASPNKQRYFQKGSHIAGNPYSFPLMHHLLVRNILVKLETKWVRGVSTNGNYEDVQTAFYISCDSDVAVHTALDCIASPATMLWAESEPVWMLPGVLYLLVRAEAYLTCFPLAFSTCPSSRREDMKLSSFPSLNSAP